MDRTLLYYPNIVIQNDQWLRQTILYWDAIGSIVPQGMEEKLYESYDIGILLREGLYRVYEPDDYVQHNDQLADEFETIMKDEYLLATRFPKTYARSIRPYNLIEYRRDWVYEQKMFRGLAERLIKKSLAKRERGKLFMDSYLIMIYMSLLAKHMANDDLESIATPGTDYPQSINLIYHRHKGNELVGAMQLSLHNILPVPVGNIQIADILKFKSKRRDELLNFRTVIYEYQEKLKQVNEPSEVKELSVRFAEKIHIEVKSLAKVFHSDRIQFMLGTVKNLLAIETPVMVSAVIAELPPIFSFPFPLQVQLSQALCH